MYPSGPIPTAGRTRTLTIQATGAHVFAAGAYAQTRDPDPIPPMT